MKLVWVFPPLGPKDRGCTRQTPQKSRLVTEQDLLQESRGEAQEEDLLQEMQRRREGAQGRSRIYLERSRACREGRAVLTVGEGSRAEQDEQN